MWLSKVSVRTRSVLGSVLRAYLGAWSQVGWECAIECHWKRPSEHAQSLLENVLGTVLGSDSEYTWERLESLLGSV